MEFKFRAIDNINPSTTPTVPYLRNRSLQMNEAALRREMEKEQIRREILRRRELEEEVRRELAMEEAFGTMQRSLVGDHIGASQQPPLIMAPPEIKHSPQISDNKDKVILLAKPDPGLYSAKRKALTPDVPNDEPSAIGLNKKPKEEWSCELCQITATSENGLNDHLNGKKHKTWETRQKMKIDDKHKKKSEKTAKKATYTVVNTTMLGFDAEKDQKTPKSCTALEVMNETRVDTESKNEEQHVETMASNGLNVTESKSEEKLVDTMVDKSVVESKNEDQLVEMVMHNGATITESKNEKKLEEMMVDKRVTESKNEEKNQNVDFFESKKGAATEEAEKRSALIEMMKVEGLWCELCQISTSSQDVMEGHIKGKKHIKKMKKFNQKNVSLSSTSFVSQHAPWWIKDTTNGVKKETDQMMTPVTNTRDGIEILNFK